LIINADRIIGSANDDVFTITDNWNGSGFSGFDASGVGQVNTNISVQIRGGAGNHTINGNGATILNAGDEFSGITLVFNAEGSGTPTGANIGTDIFTGVNAIRDSSSDDILTRAAGNQSLRGRGGSGTIDGGDGANDQASYIGPRIALLPLI
jgi:hypothetical protein